MLWTHRQKVSYQQLHQECDCTGKRNNTKINATPKWKAIQKAIPNRNSRTNISKTKMKLKLRGENGNNDKTIEAISTITFHVQLCWPTVSKETTAECRSSNNKIHVIKTTTLMTVDERQVTQHQRKPLRTERKPTFSAKFSKSPERTPVVTAAPSGADAVVAPADRLSMTDR